MTNVDGSKLFNIQQNSDVTSVQYKLTVRVEITISQHSAAERPDLSGKAMLSSQAGCSNAKSGSSSGDLAIFLNRQDSSVAPNTYMVLYQNPWTADYKWNIFISLYLTP